MNSNNSNRGGKRGRYHRNCIYYYLYIDSNNYKNKYTSKKDVTSDPAVNTPILPPNASIGCLTESENILSTEFGIFHHFV